MCGDVISKFPQYLKHEVILLVCDICVWSGEPLIWGHYVIPAMRDDGPSPLVHVPRRCPCMCSFQPLYGMRILLVMGEVTALFIRCHIAAEVLSRHGRTRHSLRKYTSYYLMTTWR